jgi:O-antigen polysaccharide polymerase Wzy
VKPAQVVVPVAGLGRIKDHRYQLKWARIFMVTIVALTALFVGIELVGGLQELLANLGDRINLFAGLNAFFLPLYLLIGVCFALSATRATGEKISALAEWAAIGITLPALLLLGSKSNIFILISRGGIKLRWAAGVALVLANLLVLYEFIFREALIIGLDPDRLKPSAWFEYMIFQLTGNFMQIQNLTVLVEALPDVLPYSFGVTYIVFFSLIIPQSIIGIKPLGATGIYTVAFWPEVVARESTTMPPGLFGEAYLNFGLPGYLIGCILVGLLLRKIDRPFQSSKAMNSMELVSIATFGSMALHFIRGEFFAPFLILVGIFLGARIVLVTAPRRVRPVRRTRRSSTFSSPPPGPVAPEPSHG